MSHILTLSVVGPYVLWWKIRRLYMQTYLSSELICPLSSAEQENHSLSVTRVIRETPDFILPTL